ncbi:MAG: hypothetical protein NTW86_11605, partial [Candidatus Sumerlaeota bacterium]|nr:hypothetical protein [Candidatus Sumerlaeota bacterium]
LRVAWHGLFQARAVLARDFGAMLSVLYNVELGQFRRFRPRCALLHPQIADLALAVGNADVFHNFVQTMRRHRVEPGAATNNLGRLAAFLEEESIEISIVQTPVNGEGWLMKPTPRACEAALANGRLAIIAERPTIHPPATREEIEAARRRPSVKSVLVDVADWDKFGGA